MLMPLTHQQRVMTGQKTLIDVARALNVSNGRVIKSDTGGYIVISGNRRNSVISALTLKYGKPFTGSYQPNASIRPIPDCSRWKANMIVDIVVAKTSVLTGETTVFVYAPD
jgi:hypothetical protein